MNKSEKFWNRVANRSEKQSNEVDQTYVKTIENTIKHLDGSDIVLDYACGTGTITIEIAEKVKEVHAIDITSRMIEVAKSNADEREIENIFFVHTTIFDERYKKESFNVLTSFNILHLLEDPQEVIRRINELIKPGGIFISATPCLGEKSAILAFFLFLLSKIGIVPYLKMLKFSDLENMITDGNFQIIETEDLQHTLPNYFIVAKKL
jgi:2-polyprenyl-3-methyl-5-hydroxy-6-metoxy-1,4-benzoquinol methylase